MENNETTEEVKTINNITSLQLANALGLSKTEAYGFLKVMTTIGAASRSGSRPNSKGKGKGVQLYTINESAGSFILETLEEYLSEDFAVEEDTDPAPVVVTPTPAKTEGVEKSDETTTVSEGNVTTDSSVTTAGNVVDGNESMRQQMQEQWSDSV